MEKNKFLFKDKIEEIQNKFIKNGWVTVYRSSKGSLIYCCLVNEDYFENYKLHSDWEIRIGNEGRSSYYEDNIGIKEIEPFVYSRHFTFTKGDERYFDISEDFILHFNLYEPVKKDKQNRLFSYIDEVGGLEEVIIITPNEIKIKQKYLLEYLFIRKMHFAICFSFDRFAEIDLNGYEEKKQSDKYVYLHKIRDYRKHFQSYIIGKAFIHYNRNKKKINIKNEKYITGYDDETGNNVFKCCDVNNEDFYILTSFKKEVLDKYYNAPSIYQIDNLRIKSNYVNLRMDNNSPNCISVFLGDLALLPYKEQLHWKSYNIPPQKTSSTFYNTMIEGSWEEHPETPDLFFKEKFQSFNEKWKSKFDWDFYKPLSEEDKHLFDSLHTPSTNNIKEFNEQILAIVKITIDSLNEKEIAKGIEKTEGGINKLDKFLHSKGFKLSKMIEFLRHLQQLRSIRVAHRFPRTVNKRTKNVIEYFELKDGNYIEVINKIFIKSVRILNTLESSFELNK